MGQNDYDLHSLPQEIISLRNSSIVEIVAGAYHNFARTGLNLFCFLFLFIFFFLFFPLTFSLLASNEWFVWGAGDTGVLGLGKAGDFPSPTVNPSFRVSINVYICCGLTLQNRHLISLILSLEHIPNLQ